MITKGFSLDDNYSILMERDEKERRIILKDNVLSNYQLMATFTNNGKWEFPSDTIEDRFWILCKQFPGIMKNNIHQEMPFVYEITFDKQFSCFKRRISISFERTINKLKHII